jgi:uncharacterized protein YbgA (DUF1722 family)/uncharacterized protein YbbK (DUF523 family)
MTIAAKSDVGPEATNGAVRSADATIHVGISSCLLGAKVRFDGGHKHDTYITGTLGQYFDFVPVCPEMAIGLGAPREPMRLVGDPDHPRAVGIRTGQLDATDRLAAYGHQMGRKLAGISGYILKRASPSCGMERVKVYDDKGVAVPKGAGIYAAAFMDEQPLLPVEEEGRLGDPLLRENFIERVFVYHRWQRLLAAGVTASKLVAFHTDHKLLIMAHSQAAYQRIGRLVARAGSKPIAALADAYVAELMTALRRRVSRGRHANILLHLSGYLKRALDGGDKAELVATIDAYRRGLVPLVVPITLLKHHFRRHPHPYVERQCYLSPHPQELMLRNNV